MSIFEVYDEEFGNISKGINKGVNELKNTDAGNTSSITKQVEALFTQANDLIKQMEIEIRSHDASTRKVMSEKVAQYKKTRASLKSDYEKAKELSERSALIGEKSADHRQRLLNANDKLSRQNEMIENAHRTILETEEVGMEITTELQRNREKILASRAKAHEFTGITDSARRLIASMSKRDVRQKSILLLVASVLIIAISLTIYFSTKK